MIRGKTRAKQTNEQKLFCEKVINHCFNNTLPANLPNVGSCSNIDKQNESRSKRPAAIAPAAYIDKHQCRSCQHFCDARSNILKKKI